jgi:hypothetical protein
VPQTVKPATSSSASPCRPLVARIPVRFPPLHVSAPVPGSPRSMLCPPPASPESN